MIFLHGTIYLFWRESYHRSLYTYCGLFCHLFCTLHKHYCAHNSTLEHCEHTFTPDHCISYLACYTGAIYTWIVPPFSLMFSIAVPRCVFTHFQNTISLKPYLLYSQCVCAFSIVISRCTARSKLSQFSVYGIFHQSYFYSFWCLVYARYR
jgi:hypothetical protein